MGSSTAFSFEARHAPAAPTEESICASHLVAVDRSKDQLLFHHLYWARSSNNGRLCSRQANRRQLRHRQHQRNQTLRCRTRDLLSRRTAFVSASALSLEQSAVRLLDQAKPVCVANYSARVDGQLVLGAVEQLRREMRSNRSLSDVVCDVPSFSRSLKYLWIGFEA